MSEQENPILGVIYDISPSEFVKVVNRSLDALVAYQKEMQQDTFQDDYYHLSRLRDALMEWKKNE